MWLPSVLSRGEATLTSTKYFVRLAAVVSYSFRPSGRPYIYTYRSTEHWNLSKYLPIIRHNFRDVTLPCSYRSTCLLYLFFCIPDDSVQLFVLFLLGQLTGSGWLVTGPLIHLLLTMIIMITIIIVLIIIIIIMIMIILRVIIIIMTIWRC